MIGRIGIAALAAAACAFGASAQSPARGEVDYALRVQAGALIPGDFKYPGTDRENDRMYNDGVLLGLGGVARVGLGSHLYLEPSLNIWYSHYGYHNLVISADGTLEGQHDPKINAFGLTLPLVLGYTFEVGDAFAFSIFTGPEATFWGAAKAKTDLIPDEDRNILGSMSLLGTQRRWEMGWKFGVAVPYDRYELTIAGSLGMTNVLRPSGAGAKEHMDRFLVGLGMYF